MRFFGIIVIACLLCSCSGDQKTGKDNSDTPTSGHVRVGADDSYRLIMEAEELVFESLYTDAEVDITYANEDSMVELLLKDSIRFALMTRKLTPQEEKIITNKTLEVTYTKVAIDGVALIVHPENKLKGLTLPQIRKILAGELGLFSQLNDSCGKDSIRVVFDHPLSCNARYMKDSLMAPGADFPKNCFAVKSNEEVVEYVAQHKNTIGVLGVNWLSDRDDSLSHSFLQKVKVLGVSTPSAETIFNEPYQAYIAKGMYPLIREVYIVKVEVGAGLGTGFAAFIAGEKGQRIILKSGIVPSIMPLRIVEIKQ